MAPARTATALLGACHPEPALAVTGFAAVLAHAAGHDPQGVALVATAVLSGQLSVGWLNDVLDADRDRAAGRTDKPVATGAIARRTVAWAAALAALACVPLSIALGLLAGTLHLLAVASGWLYDLGVKATLGSVLPYVVSFALAPSVVVLALPGAPAPAWWLPLAGALLGAGAHFANALPDLDIDVQQGICGLPHRLGPARARAAAAVLLLAAVVLIAAAASLAVQLAYTAPVLAVALILGGFTAQRVRPQSRLAFRAVLLVAALAVAMLIGSGEALVAG